MTVHEPATLLTDLLLGALGFAFAWSLRRSPAGKSKAGSWWCLALLCMAASAFTGGLYHGFAPEVPAPVEVWWWRATLWWVCALALTMEMSLLNELAPRRGRGVWMIAIGVKAVVFAAMASMDSGFLVAMAAYGLAMFAWAAAAAVVRRPWRRAMLAGVGLSALAGAIQRMVWELADGFNHNDLFRLVQAVALFAFHRAGRSLGSAQESGGSTA